MPATEIILRQKGCAWLRPVLSATPGVEPDDYISSGATPIEALGAEIPFDYVGGAGPNWPAAEAAGDSDPLEVVTGSGITVVYPRETKRINPDGSDASSGAGGGDGPQLRFVALGLGTTILQQLVAIQGKLVLCCIPVGENYESTEDGFLYILGRYTSPIEYMSEAETPVDLQIEITGLTTIATGGGDTALLWNPAAITPVGESDPVDPPVLTTTDRTKLKTGGIVIK
jgi:hypothetical protein